MIGNYMYRTTPGSSWLHRGDRLWESLRQSLLGEDVAARHDDKATATAARPDRGARYNNVFATYSHGSLLPKNPVLCDFCILQTALDRRHMGPSRSYAQRAS